MSYISDMIENVDVWQALADLNERELEWDEVMEDVLDEYAEAWEALAKK